MRSEVEADLPLLTADLGVPVTFAGAPDGLMGIPRQGPTPLVPGEVAEFGTVLGEEKSVLVPHTAAALVRLDAPITVDGVDYTVSSKRPLGAGYWCRLILAEA